MKKASLAIGVTGVLLYVSVAYGGTISTVGDVLALTDTNQLQNIYGTATFNEGSHRTAIPLGIYSDIGMTFHLGQMSEILPGVDPTTAKGGSGVTSPDWVPSYGLFPEYFPNPVNGGGIAEGMASFHAGVVTFNVPVTQFGLTASSNDTTTYITVWDVAGNFLGQVSWTPDNDSAFVGIDTLGVEIGLLAYGNDNLFAGVPYDETGGSTISDTWVWAVSDDTDNDGFVDSVDNCPDTPNSGQEDTDYNGVGDACNSQEDVDGDEYADYLDNCPDDFNADQADADFDLIGDVCDPFPNDPDNEQAQLEVDLAQAQA
jgi:hypothetical protein